MNLPHLYPIPHYSPKVVLPTISCFPLSLTRRTVTFTISAGLRENGSKPIPARDRVIDFGKYKGRMLGTLPSKYLKWVSKNLRARDFVEWAQLADEVLSDTMYKDRIEWEFAQNILNGDVSIGNQSAVSDLLEISTRFGWDNDDKLGWSRIDFDMLGTSKGGQIPRLSGSNTLPEGNKKGTEGVDSVDGGEKGSRERRREKMRLQRKKNDSSMAKLEKVDNFSGYNTSKDDSVRETPSRFPGREALLNKAMSLGRRTHF